MRSHQPADHFDTLQRYTNARMLSQYHMDASREATRATFLLNGGALAAAMTFIGKVVETHEKSVSRQVLGISFGLFALGAALAVPAYILMWWLQAQTELLQDPTKEVGFKVEHWQLRCILGAALFAFITGSASAGYAVFIGQPS